MPLYEYKCEACQSTTGYLRPTARRNEPAVCPECGGVAKRTFSIPQKYDPTEKSANRILHDPEVWR